jgi:plastocyanin
MIRILAVIGAATVLGVAAVTSALGQGASTPTLKGTVGPGFTISLTKSGKKIKTLKPGTYKVTVNDKSSAHNFTLERETKPKIEKHVSSTAFTGTKSMTVTLKKGEWKFYCSVHESTMHGSFMVK